jgi:hypothetical protein
MGWDNAPYTMYPLPQSVARLNGEFNPGGPDPSTNAGGAVTYRIDPRTGKYNFYRTDIRPRGVFMQNTFQHPAPSLMSALRIPISGGLSGLSCNGCGGRCSSSLSGPRRRRRRGMGADPNSDTFVDSNTGCIVDTDGNLLTCPSGPGGRQQPTETSSPVTPTDPALLQQLISAGKQISTAITAPKLVVQQQPPSWWDGKTLVGGMAVPNPALAAGAVGFALLLAGMGGKRR